MHLGCALGLCAENCSLEIFFSIGTYPELSENCYMGDWTFDNSFLFMGSMATTIGYGHIVPQEMVTNHQSFGQRKPKTSQKVKESPVVESDPRTR